MSNIRNKRICELEEINPSESDYLLIDGDSGTHRTKLQYVKEFILSEILEELKEINGEDGTLRYQIDKIKATKSALRDRINEYRPGSITDDTIFSEYHDKIKLEKKEMTGAGTLTPSPGFYGFSDVTLKEGTSVKGSGSYITNNQKISIEKNTSVNDITFLNEGTNTVQCVLRGGTKKGHAVTYEGIVISEAKRVLAVGEGANYMQQSDGSRYITLKNSTVTYSGNFSSTDTGGSGDTVSYEARITKDGLVWFSYSQKTAKSLTTYVRLEKNCHVTLVNSKIKTGYIDHDSSNNTLQLSDHSGALISQDCLIIDGDEDLNFLAPSFTNMTIIFGHGYDSKYKSNGSKWEKVP